MDLTLYLQHLRNKSFRSEALPKGNQLFCLRPQQQPLDVEIGCGVGWHPIQYAKLHPQRTLIAIEHTQDKFNKFYRRFINHQCPTQLIPVHANAISWISHCLKPEQVDRYLILYPNPYPKVQDRNKRFYAMPFFNKLVETLKLGGEIICATNDANYAKEMVIACTELWALDCIEKQQIAMSEAPRTHFEKKYLAKGEVCVNLIFRKANPDQPIIK